ncbi:MAG: type II secretion system ATPase GspE [Gammaproteobacteria bacterium]|nr:type II secretion system ATPase GspE [Gammaproteobacteria bacterium]
MSEPGERQANPPPGLPFAFAKRQGVLLQAGPDGRVTAWHRPGTSLEGLAEVRRFAGRPLTFRSLDAEAFDDLLARAYEGGAQQAGAIIENVEEDLALADVAREIGEPEDLLESEDDAPVIRLINALLTEAIRGGASDIHIEPLEKAVRVRFRVDGILREVLRPKRALGPLLVSRIKVMAALDIAEKRLPQDGRISLRIAGRAVDVRVSCIPGAHGERVVLRLLDKQSGRLTLEQLGVPRDQLETLEELIHRPHGILLVTGPTGSGKTTTLYAALLQLNDHSRNLMTVEDPIEYYLEGVGQTQVNTRVDMSFARGLRAILRQDPDVVMVGEIRDLETAQIAVQASLTGHLVLSTLHTNSAVAAITRLRDMGIESFLLASSVIGVLSQRLVRLLCPECKAPYTPDAAELARLGLDAPTTLYRPVGCDACDRLGYRGRSGIFELLTVDERLRTLIHDDASEQSLATHAHADQARLHQDGLRRVLRGETSLEEVLRVTREE